MVKAKEDIVNAHPLRVAVSDGVVVGDGDVTYKRLPDDHESVQRWLTKLGEMLKRELMPPHEQKKHYYLEFFPEHYHLRAKFENGVERTKDRYLYGHKKRDGKIVNFRSPEEFFPHLVWLATLREGQCSCLHCHIEDKASRQKEKAKAGPALKKLSAPTPAPKKEPDVPKSRPSTPKSTSKTAKCGPKTPKPGQSERGGSKCASPATPADGEVSVKPSSTSRRQSLQAERAWRIGLVLQACANPAAFNSPLQYLISPFTYAKSPVDRGFWPENDIRPFLAYSVPQVNPNITALAGSRIIDINWDALESQFGIGNDQQQKSRLALEASKLAATLVDHSYSTFNPVQPLFPNVEAFNGVFLGAEKIFAGETIRIHLAPQEKNSLWDKSMPVVMLVFQILIKQQQDGTRSLMFYGDIWRLEQTSLQQPSPDQSRIAPSMHREKFFRDEVLRSRGMRVDWVLIVERVVKTEGDVRGRFYETRQLAPILNPDKFNQDLQQGQVNDLQTFLNNRGSSEGPDKGRMPSRADTVAGAVPHAVFENFRFEDVDTVAQGMA
ncbi:hypothetical protein F4780DRAFT_777765 [Xylariomycetidae sp. FL0641]|nr:hypothetical protein F4780DRAFT_777765 [Xylariomycetidae sp. FL0641]